MSEIKSKKNTKNTRPIGIFDSGVGGLSVLHELEKILPNENFVFLADQLYVPYGEKTNEELVDLTTRITNYFVKNHDIKMMVVACNTATCGAIGELREKFSFPIVGTVPAVKTAAENTKTKSIAVISTPSTSQSEALKKLIKDNCEGLEVFNIGCKNLENVVEEGELHSKPVNDLLVKYLTKVKGSKVDYLVLGCTHYPFLKKYIRKMLGSKVNLIDGGKAIAKHTKSLLINHILENTDKKAGDTLYFTTGDAKKFGRVASKLLKSSVEANKVKI